MAWFAVYQISDGELVSVTSIDPTGTLPGGLDFVNVGATRPVGVWNTTTLQFDPPPPIRKITKDDFLKRWTNVELREVMAARDQENINVRAFKNWLIAVDDIDLDDGLLVAGMDRLVTEGILTTARRDAILADG